MEKTFCVYMHTNKINGKKYIGQTCQTLLQRCGKNGEKYICCPVFFKAITKYGWENFDHEILFDNLTKTEADKKEADLIKEYKTQEKRHGYNLKDGGSRGELDEETKRKIGLKSKCRKLSEEARKKVAEAKRGKKQSAECINKRSRSLKQYYSKEENKRVGFCVSEETRKKMSDSRKGIKFSDEHKRKISKARKKYYGANSSRSTPVFQYDRNGNFIKEWDYILLASKELGINNANIGRCCRGELKTAGGFVWKYKEANDGTQD